MRLSRRGRNPGLLRKMVSKIRLLVRGSGLGLTRHGILAFQQAKVRISGAKPSPRCRPDAASMITAHLFLGRMRASPELLFQVPNVGDADTFAYYIEAKYKFTPQFFGAVRWNQQLFGTVNDGFGHNVQWSNDLGRIDIAATYRFTPHAQIKLQYDFQHETTGEREDNHLFADQFTIRF